MKIATLSVLAVGLAASAASAQTFNYAGAAVGIPDNNPGGVTLTLNSNQALAIQGITVNVGFGTGASSATTPVGNREHTWAGDLVMTLSHDDGSTVATATLMRRVGSGTATGFGSGNDMNGLYTFSDAATASLWTVVAVGGNNPAGTYLAQNNIFSGTAGTSAVAVSLNSIFGGRSGTGTWSLFVSDGADGDVGDIVSFGINITPVPAPGALALVGLGGLVAARRRR